LDHTHYIPVFKTSDRTILNLNGAKIYHLPLEGIRRGIVNICRITNRLQHRKVEDPEVIKPELSNWLH
jgi:hypothetical protein